MAYAVGVSPPLRPIRSLAAIIAMPAIAFVLSSRGVNGGPQAGGDRTAVPAVVAPAFDAPNPVDLPGIHNLVAYQGDAARTGFWSGSAPEGDAGFESLAALGVRTVISVDGAVPEVARAKAHGLRYVHLPIGYDGFDDARRAELVRAVRDLPGPVYIHCHHGKHRSAGAAASIALALGWLTNEAALERMRVSRTAAGYRGLWACAREGRPMPAAEIDAASDAFPEATRPDDLVEAMVAIDLAVEHLKAIEKAGWRVPDAHPDLVPAAEAGRLADLLRLLDANAISAARCVEPSGGSELESPADEVRRWIARDAAAAGELEAALAEVGTPSSTSTSSEARRRARLSRAFGVVTAGCGECHARHRD